MRRFLAGLLAALMVLSLCACGAADAPGKTDGQTAAVSWDELVFDRTMPLRYAEQFSVEYAGDSYKRITINNDRVYLLVAEGTAVPDGVPTGVTVLQQPLDQIYLVAAAAMDYFDKLNAIHDLPLPVGAGAAGASGHPCAGGDIQLRDPAHGPDGVDQAVRSAAG